MKKCEREECGNFTNVMHENKCNALKEVPSGECFAFMTKEHRKRVEKEIKRRMNPFGGGAVK